MIIRTYVAEKRWGKNQIEETEERMTEKDARPREKRTETEMTFGNAEKNDRVRERETEGLTEEGSKKTGSF